MVFFLGFSSCANLALLFATGFLVLVESYYMISKSGVLNDKALQGYAFRNITKQTLQYCLFECSVDCFCMAFHIFKNTECQLLSSSRFQSPSALITMKGFAYYDMIPGLRKMKMGDCNSSPTCHVYDNLCQNGGSHVPITPTDITTPRYMCSCPPGYGGQFCKNIIKSCRGYSRSSRKPGKYKVLDANMAPFEVFCDFDTNSSMTWTLIQSYQLQHRKTFDNAYSKDLPVNEDTPRWDEYRLSKSRMQSIQNDSTKFRITCKYDIDGVVYRDYVRTSKKQLDILTFDFRHDNNPPVCSSVEYIDVRGNYCSNCTVALLQSNDYILHTDSGTAILSTFNCQFQPSGGRICNTYYGEDNFGHYFCSNSAHRCSSSSAATTQTWLGGN